MEEGKIKRALPETWVPIKKNTAKDLVEVKQLSAEC